MTKLYDFVTASGTVMLAAEQTAVEPPCVAVKAESDNLALVSGPAKAHASSCAQIGRHAKGTKMDVEQNLETVRQGYAAFSSGDMDTLMKLYSDDAVHVVPGESRVSGSHKGKDSILTLYAALFELSGGTFRIQLDHVLSDGGDRVVSIHTSSMEKDGETITQTEVLLFTLVNGKVAEIQDFFADISLNDRLFS